MCDLDLYEIITKEQNQFVFSCVLYIYSIFKAKLFHNYNNYYFLSQETE